MASSAEREIRDAVAAWFRANEPRGRVIHELPLSAFSGDGRADLAVAFPDTLVLIEVKSERDKLDRLERQWKSMSERSHDMKVVAHDKWFAEDGRLKDQSWMNWAHKEHLWRYPSGASGWTFNRYVPSFTPSPYHLLGMLWADELRDCYALSGVMASSRGLNMQPMVRDLVDKLTGQQIRSAVCQCLRARNFAEADAAIPLTLAGAS